VVLLDEPTVGVDPQSRERIYEMLASLQKTGVSIVLTTHHLEEAEQRCERLVIIDHGKIVASGTVNELLQTTLGTARTLKVTLADGRTLNADVRNVGRDVAKVLTDVAAAGGDVTDMDLAGATLRDVFIALTGRELRE
jgi:ABC-2 type transport system ATP-binding protein